MAKIEDNKSKTSSAKRMGNPPRRMTNAQKVEELKLGKFAECEHLRLPEKQLGGRWRMMLGIGLLLLAALGVFLIFMTDPVRVLTWDNDGFSGGRIGSLQLYWWVMELALGVATLSCLIAGIILVLRKRVPALIWYILVIATTLGLLCASFHTFTWFEARNCYENYPGIYPSDPSKGSGCPSVMNDLILLSLRNLLIYTVGIVIFALIYRYSRKRAVLCKS